MKGVHLHSAKTNKSAFEMGRLQSFGEPVDKHSSDTHWTISGLMLAHKTIARRTYARTTNYN